MMWKENNPRTTLDKFCMWAAVNSLREHEVGHYDFAMYLSRGRMKPAGKGRVHQCPNNIIIVMFYIRNEILEAQ